MPSYDEVTQRSGSLRAMTGLTEPESTALLPHFERALAAYLQNRTIDGQPRTSRRYSAYDNCPLPTIADKLLFILTYLKQNPIQEVQGQLFGMSQSNANKWIHVLHPVLASPKNRRNNAKLCIISLMPSSGLCQVEHTRSWYRANVRLKQLFIIMDPPTMPYTPQRQYAIASSVCQVLEVH